MNISDYAKLDGVAIAAAIANGDYSRSEVTEVAIATIEALNPKLNAVVMENYANARASAVGTGPIAGVPFLIKDVNVFTADMPTTFSCRFFDGVAPRADSEIVKRWRNAGLVVLGKTNTPEFAEDYVCEPTFRGPALNPWNPAMTTGGSSGGAGAAVASGMVPIAHGTDLGGSIRIPAACCGVFGLKPTTGLNAVDVSHPELASGFNSDHVLTRSVRDSAAVLDATAWPITGYRYQPQRAVPSYLQCLELDLPPLRIGICTKTPDGKQTPATQSAAVERVGKILSDHGHVLVEYEYPQELEFGEWMDTLWMFDVVYEMDRRIAELGRQPEADELEAMTRHIRELVASMSAMDHYHARLNAHQNSVRLMTSMADLDIVLTPALGSDPVAVGEFDSRTDAFDYKRWAEQGYDFAPFSYICNISGQPAASIPVPQKGSLKDGPPCAIQLAGHLGQDHLLLQLSAMLEQELDWQASRPPIWAGNS
ncbi:MAG: amidase [Planctomycetota bacterium]|jgi:amidase